MGLSPGELAALRTALQNRFGIDPTELSSVIQTGRSRRWMALAFRAWLRARNQRRE